MGSELFVGLVVEAPDRGVLDRPVHPFHLSVCPRMLEFCEPMLDAVLCAGQVEGMCSKRLMGAKHLLDFLDAPTALRRCELEAVVPSETEVMTRQALL